MLVKATLTSHERDGRHHGCCGLLHRCWLTTAFGFFSSEDVGEIKNQRLFFWFFFFLVGTAVFPEKSSCKWRSVPPTTGPLAH